MRIGFKTIWIASFVVVALESGKASAALITYDGVNYAAGALNGNNGGTGWSGAYQANGTNNTVVDANGLTYQNLQVEGGSVRTTTGGATTLLNFRNLNNVYGDDETGETWISFLGRRNGVTATNLFAGISFYNSSGTGTADGEVSFANTTVSPLVWRILDLGANLSTNTNISIASDTTYLLVARIVWNTPDAGLAGATTAGNEAVYLYVNPTIGGGTPTTASANAGRNITLANFDKIRVAGQNAVDYTFDEFRIGSTFDDVTPIPEPSAILLSCLAAAGLLGCFHRRRG